MDTHHTSDDRFSQLARSNARWRLLAVSSLALIVGIGIGGMGNRQPSETRDPKGVIDYAATDGRIFRFHNDGSISYIRIPDGERTGMGYYNWGQVKIDKRYTSTTIPQP